MGGLGEWGQWGLVGLVGVGGGGHSPALSSASRRSNSSTALAELLNVELQIAEKVAAMEQAVVFARSPGPV